MTIDDRRHPRLRILLLVFGGLALVVLHVGAGRELSVHAKWPAAVIAAIGVVALLKHLSLFGAVVAWWRRRAARRKASH